MIAAMTGLEQIREDQALGAAWRRCEAALPATTVFGLEHNSDGWYEAWTEGPDYLCWGGTNPLLALTALAEKLEARAAA